MPRSSTIFAAAVLALVALVSSGPMQGRKGGGVGRSIDRSIDDRPDNGCHGACKEGDDEQRLGSNTEYNGMGWWRLPRQSPIE